jgi:hypothetical protein
MGAFLAQRDAHAALVVEQQVLAKGHRALLCYGAAHLVHPDLGLRMPPSLASIIEQRTGERMYTICGLVPSAADPGGLVGQLSGTRAARSSRPPAPGSGLSTPGCCFMSSPSARTARLSTPSAAYRWDRSLTSACTWVSPGI